jgi:Na+/phosphate symporter
MNKESLEKEVKQSLQNSLRIAVETQNISKHTESILENQREQFQSIDRTLDDTKQSLKRLLKMRLRGFSSMVSSPNGLNFFLRGYAI